MVSSHSKPRVFVVMQKFPRRRSFSSGRLGDSVSLLAISRYHELRQFSRRSARLSPSNGLGPAQESSGGRLLAVG